MRSRTISWILCFLHAVASSGQLPEVRFPEIDPLYTDPLPPLGLLEPDHEMDVIDTRYANNRGERQTLRLTVQLLPNDVRRITTTADVHGIPVKRPHHWRRSAPLGHRLYIPPKVRLTNVYHYKTVSGAFRRCTKRGRIIRPWEQHTAVDTRVRWDTIVHGDTLVLQRGHFHFTDTTRSSIFREVWSRGRLLNFCWGIRTQGVERIEQEHSYTYSGDSVFVVHRQPTCGTEAYRTLVHTQRDAHGRPTAISRTHWIPPTDGSEEIRRVLHLLDYDTQGRITCMEEFWDEDRLIHSLIMNYR